MNRIVKAGEFKAKCLKLLDDVAASGDTLVITKRGRPVAELRPTPASRPHSLIGCLKGTITYMSDVISPVDEEWEVLKE